MSGSVITSAHNHCVRDIKWLLFDFFLQRDDTLTLNQGKMSGEKRDYCGCLPVNPLCSLWIVNSCHWEEGKATEKDIKTNKPHKTKRLKGDPNHKTNGIIQWFAVWAKCSSFELVLSVALWDKQPSCTQMKITCVCVLHAHSVPSHFQSSDRADGWS